MCEYQRLYRAIRVRISAFVPGNSCANISVCVRLHKAKLFTGDCCVPVAVYHLLFILTGMTENRVNFKFEFVVILLHFAGMRLLRDITSAKKRVARHIYGLLGATIVA